MFVLTHRPSAVPDPAVTFLSCDITAAVGTAKAAAGGKDVEIPGTLGGGTPLFSPTGLDRVNLEPVSSGRIGPATSLRFRVRTCGG